MKNRFLIICTVLFLSSCLAYGQEQASVTKDFSENKQGCIQHPWQGKKVGYIGDSITDPNCYGDNIKKYWDFLKEWLGITPFVYGISGRQWDDVPRQAEKLKKNMAEKSMLSWFLWGQTIIIVVCLSVSGLRNKKSKCCLLTVR